LEGRVILSATAIDPSPSAADDASNDAAAVLATTDLRSMTSAELGALNIAEVEWAGQSVYAVKNEWLVNVNLDHLPSPMPAPPASSMTSAWV
jgi:hypothetical protein